MAEVAEKVCGRCGITAPSTDFPWKDQGRGRRGSWCRSCQRAYAHDHYLRNIDQYKAKARKTLRGDRQRLRQRVDDFLATHPCVDCGTADIAVLEFDHRDPAEKRMAVSTLASRRGWPAVEREIAKCEVRCANCHRRRTARQFDWARTKELGTPGPTHALPTVERVDPKDADFLLECSMCGWLRPPSQFAFRSVKDRTLSDHCRRCHATYRRQHYLRNRDRYFKQANAQTRRKRDDTRQRIREHLLGHPCADCREADIATLDFDHVDPSTKVTEVAKMVGHRSWDGIQAEIAKCVVRCANCHRHRTIAQRREAPQNRVLVEFAAARE